MRQLGTVEVTTDGGSLVGSVPVVGGFVVRTEQWVRDGRRVAVEVMDGEVVLVSTQLFHEMLAELGFERVTEV